MVCLSQFKTRLSTEGLSLHWFLLFKSYTSPFEYEKLGLPWDLSTLFIQLSPPNLYFSMPSQWLSNNFTERLQRAKANVIITITIPIIAIINQHQCDLDYHRLHHYHHHVTVVHPSSSDFALHSWMGRDCAAGSFVGRIWQMALFKCIHKNLILKCFDSQSWLGLKPKEPCWCREGVRSATWDGRTVLRMGCFFRILYCMGGGTWDRCQQPRLKQQGIL